MPHTDMSLPSFLGVPATTQGDATAFTFTDGTVLGSGDPDSLAWSQMYRRVPALAEDLRRTATKNDRAAPESDSVKHEAADVVWKSRNLRVGDLVSVSPGSIPITTSAKIHRSSCPELCREGEFQRLDIAG